MSDLKTKCCHVLLLFNVSPLTKSNEHKWIGLGMPGQMLRHNNKCTAIRLHQIVRKYVLSLSKYSAL